MEAASLQERRLANQSTVSFRPADRLLVAHCPGVSGDIYCGLEVGNASLTVMERDGEKRRLRVLDDTGHLEELGQFRSS